MSKNREFVIQKGVLKRYKGAAGDIRVPDGVKQIGRGAFAGCHTLTRVSLPEGVRRVGQRAFFDCSSLARVELPATVKQIDREAFGGCISLMGLELPPSVKKLGKGAFAGCSSLTRLVLPKGVRGVRRSTFRGCPMAVAVPYLPVKQFKKGSRPEAAQHFAAARLTKLNMRRKIRTGYLNYIRSRRKRLYPAAVESEELLWLMLQENMVPQKEVPLLLEQAENQGKWTAKAAILAYDRQRFQPGKKKKFGKKAVQ